MFTRNRFNKSSLSSALRHKIKINTLYYKTRVCYYSSVSTKHEVYKNYRECRCSSAQVIGHKFATNLCISNGIFSMFTKESPTISIFSENGLLRNINDETQSRRLPDGTLKTDKLFALKLKSGDWGLFPGIIPISNNNFFIGLHMRSFFSYSTNDPFKEILVSNVYKILCNILHYDFLVKGGHYLELDDYIKISDNHEKHTTAMQSKKNEIILHMNTDPDPCYSNPSAQKRKVFLWGKGKKAEEEIVYFSINVENRNTIHNSETYYFNNAILPTRYEKEYQEEEKRKLNGTKYWYPNKNYHSS